jgi:UDP-sulfoquinovose synthase
MGVIASYKDRVDQRLILPGVNWKESASVGKNVAAK